MSLLRITLIAACSGALLSASSAVTAAQTQLPSVDGRLLRAGVDTFVATVQHGDATDTTGVAIQSYERVTWNGQPAWLQVYRWIEPGGRAPTDSLTMDAETLRPLAEARYQVRGTAHLVYSPGHVHADEDPSDGPPTTRDTPLPRPVFSSATMDALARALPLADGYETQVDFLFFFPVPNVVVPGRIVVTGSETVEDRAGRPVECWVVQVLDGTMFWIDKSSRMILRYATLDHGNITHYQRPTSPLPPVRWATSSRSA